MDEGTCPFKTWYGALRQPEARVKVQARLRRLRTGNFGDHRELDGIGELRIDVGPGYRIYYGRRGDRLVLLLGAGDKKTQSADIEAAKRLWEELKRHAE